MATIGPIQVGAAKITLPSNLPKNEKDIICMILAGRLKDLFNGRLICVELAIDDLIEQATGLNVPAKLQEGLSKLKDKINELKESSGYDAALEKMNAALSQIENVFSLGGLCPTPVHAPKIPDILSKLNMNMFGQASNILNALARVSNPKMCLGGGPDGFGVNWESMTGSLADLKRALDAFAADPAGMQSTLNSFARNMERQTNRLGRELKRLENNLTDPFGVNKAKRTANNIIALKNRTDGYPVKGANGVVAPNVMKSMLPPDIEAAAAFGDTTPVATTTVPILDYCGDVVGFETVSTIDGYGGWSTDPDAINQDTPTALPVAEFKDYDFNFVADSNNQVTVYNKEGSTVDSINIERGKYYRLGFHNTPPIAFFIDANTVWTDGLEYNQEPEFGKGIELILPDSNTRFTNGYVDWQVSIQSPVTPDTITWATQYSQFGQIYVTGATALLPRDKTFDVAEAVRKALLHIETTTAEENGFAVENEDSVTRQYTYTANLYNGGQLVNNSSGSLTEGVNYFVTQDDEGFATIESVHDIGSNKLIVVRELETLGETQLKKLSVYVSTTTSALNATDSFVVNMAFDGADPVTVPAQTRLEAEDHYSYILVTKNNNNIVTLKNSDTTTWTYVQEGKQDLIRWQLTSNINSAQVPENDFMLQTDIAVDPADIGTFDSTNPKQHRVYLYVKNSFGTAIELDIRLVQ